MSQMLFLLKALMRRKRFSGTGPASLPPGETDPEYVATGYVAADYVEGTT